MVKISKVSTSNGDDGFTTVLNPERLHKNSVRIEAIGSVDELLSWIGLLRASFRQNSETEILKAVARIQNDLFDLGSELAFIAPDKSPMPITKKSIRLLENAIEKYNKGIPALKSFVLPGSSETDAWLHICRSVCRRAERKVAQFNTDMKTGSLNQIYLNRLSDLLFVWSRYIARKNGTEEILWQNTKDR